MLVLVVGPSGAGKDTLLDVARATLEGDDRFRFVRRTITRSAEAGGEAHEAVSRHAFAHRRFALQWHAHGIDYGIPLAIEAELEAKRVVVASVSRTVIADAAARYAVRVIEVTAPADMLAARLASRGREDHLDIARRLARTVELPAGVAVEQVMNDATVEIGAARFLAALSRAAQPVRR
jgi:ribose 1,5-bisphosphokinase